MSDSSSSSSSSGRNAVVIETADNIGGGMKWENGSIPEYDAGYGSGFIADCRRFFDNKWVRLIVYAVTLFTTDCLIYGWQQYSAMMYKGGAYDWLCPEGWDYNIDGACDAQEDAVTKMYSVSSGIEYSFALVAGFMLDHVGPKLTGSIGVALLCLGQLLLCYSSESFQAYYPAIMISAGCVNIIGFPALILGDIFPKFASVSVSIVLGAMTGCTLIPPILYSTWNHLPASVTFRQMWGYYTLVVIIPIGIVYIIALPSRSGFKRELQYARMVQRVTLMQKEKEEEMLKRNASQVVDLADVENVKRENTDTGLGTGSTSNSISGSNLDRAVSGSFVQNDSDAIDLVAMQGMMDLADEESAKWSEFWGAMKTWDFFGIAMFYMIEIFLYSYYPSVVYNDISEEVSHFLGWFTPTQMVWGVLFGYFMDYYGTTIYMISQVLILVVVSVLAPIQNLALEYVVSILFCIWQGSIFTPKYTFCVEMFDRPHFGKLVGVLGLLGGCAALCNMPVSVADNYTAIFYSYAAISILPLGLNIWMLWRQLQGHCHRTKAQPKPPYTMRKATAAIIAKQDGNDELAHELDSNLSS